jgi:hypothetical protein
LELVERKNEISVNSHDVCLGSGAVIGLAGSSVRPSKLFNVLHELIVVEFIYTKENQERDVFESTQEKISSLVVENKLAVSNINVNNYVNNIALLFALIIAADGVIEDDEIELAIDFINEEELITDKLLMIDLFEDNLQKLMSSKEKSSAIFKLQVEKIISKIEKIDDNELMVRFDIMLNGLLESVSHDGESITKSILERINKKVK